MNALSNESASTVIPLLTEAVGDIQTRKSFGITRLLVNMKPFAIIKSGRLFFRVDEKTSGDFDKAERKYSEEMLVPPGLSSGLNYRQVPSNVLHDQPTLDEWAKKAAVVGEKSLALLI